MRFYKIFAVSVLSVSMVMPYAVLAEEKIEPIYYGAYYDEDNILVGVKNISMSPSEEETELLMDLYKPEEAVTARVYKWGENLKPLDAVEVYSLDNEDSINIIHTNDMHGNLVPSSSVIGIDKIAMLKSMSNNTLLVDAGDATQGVSFATLTSGEDVIKMMNLAGYDAMALGNHEFDYGLEKLLKNQSLAEFPIISANTYYENKPLMETETSNGQNCIYTVDGMDVGIFALTTTETRTATNPDGIKGVEFKDEAETAKEQVEYLKENGADVIIALAHLGTNENVECTSIELASKMKDTGLNAIIDGHSHTVVNTVQDGITIAQTGTGEAYVGEMSIAIDENGSVQIEEKMLTPNFFANIEPKKDVTDELNKIVESQKKITEKVVSSTESSIWGGYVNNVAEARVHETNLGDLICDSMIAGTKRLIGDEYSDLPIVAIENGGGIRATIANGDVTWGDVIDVLPFANTVMFKEVTPKIIYDILELSVSSVSSQDSKTGMITATMSGGFLQIGGMRFEYDPNAETGSKVKNVYFDGSEKALSRTDEETKIILASNDYLIVGGNDYTMLKDLKTLGEGGGLDTLLLTYMNELTSDGKKKLNYPVTQGRIKTVGSYNPSDYTANIYVKTEAGASVLNQDVSYYVDGEEKNGTTDENGILKITVSDGPHAVKLYENQHEVYVNNYSGAGVIEAEGEYPVPFPTLVLE